MRIELKNLHYSVAGVSLLKGIYATFGEEEQATDQEPSKNRIYGIIGPNGCGKTTLLRHLYRELPSKGSILVDGKYLETYTGREYARKVAVMMQVQDFADSNLTVYDVVQTGRYPYKKVMMPYNQEDEALTRQVLKTVGLWEMRQRRVGTLSGGELQRVMVSRFFSQNPQAILLDEPTNHLDIRYKLELMNLLKGFPGMVLMTIHDLNLAAQYCDRLYLMKEGQFLASGSPKEILTQDKLEEAFQVRLEILQNKGRVFVGV